MKLNTKKIEDEYNAGTLSPQEREAWEGMRDNVPISKPEHLDEDTFYSVLENKAHKGNATPRELKTVKDAALNGIYTPKVMTFEDDKKERKALPGYARSDSDSLLGDVGDFATGFARGAGKGLTNTGEEAHKIFNSATGQDNTALQANQNSRKESDAALYAGHPVSSTVGDIAGSIAATAPLGGIAGGGLKAIGLARTGAAVASPVGQFALQGALAPTEGGTFDRAANIGLNTALGSAAHYGLPLATAGIKKAGQATKALLGGETPITEAGAEKLAATAAADQAGVTVTPADTMNIGGTGREFTYLAGDTPLSGIKDIYQRQQQEILQSAKNLGSSLKQANADVKFDGTNDLVNLASTHNPHAEEAARAAEAMLDASKNGTWRDVVQAQTGGNLVLRKAKAADGFKQIADAAEGVTKVPESYASEIDSALKGFEKNKLITPAIKGEVEGLKSNLDAIRVKDADGNSTSEIHPQNLGGMMDALQSLRGRIYGLQSEGVIGTRDLAVLRKIENGLSSDIKSGLGEADPSLLQKYDSVNDYYAKEIAPFHDQTLSNAIRSFGADKSEVSIYKSVEDADRFKQIAPLLGAKGKSAFAEGVYNDMLDDITTKAGRSDAFNMNDLKRQLDQHKELFGKVIESPDHAAMLDGLQKTLNLIAPGNRVASTLGKRTAVLGSPALLGAVVGGGLGAREGGIEGGAAGASAGASLPLLGYMRAIRFLSNNPTMRDKLIRIGNLPPSSPAAQAYKLQVGRALGTTANAELNSQRSNSK